MDGWMDGWVGGRVMGKKYVAEKEQFGYLLAVPQRVP
jgi:hypothetical protein